MAKNKALKLALALLIASSAASAQNPESYYEEIPRTFYGGLIAGANFTQVDGDNYAGYYKVGVNAGGIVYTKFDEHFAASIEILYSQKGSVSNSEQRAGTAYIYSYNFRLNYAEVPLQLCYFDKRRSHFGAGFSIARLVSVKESGEATGTFGGNTYGAHTTFDNTFFDNYPVRKMDYNFIIGGNLHLWQGLFLNARFQYSLRPIRKGDLSAAATGVPPGFAGRGEQYNNMWTVRMMYLF